jgi:peptidoglycan/xylan/chitin deacetylase (PgdA/CDA1 family)
VIGRAIEKLRRRERQNAPRSDRALILLYHRVASLRSDPWSLAVTPRRFEEHLEVLRREAHPIRLERLPRALVDSELPDRAVAVTFDDGYADNLYSAKPLLERYDVPATVFLPSGLLGTKREFWWDELDGLLLQPGRLPGSLRMKINGKAHRWQLGEAARYPRSDLRHYRHWRAWEDPPSPRHALYKSMWDLMHALPANERNRVLVELRGWAGVEQAGRSSHRLLSVEEAVDLARGGTIEIGAHTVTHPSLSTLPVDSQRLEIVRSKATLEDIVGVPVTSFAYPYGKRSDYSGQTITLVREAAFARACTNFTGLVKRSTDGFQLPRLQVHDWDGDAFLEQLVKWFDG